MKILQINSVCGFGSTGRIVADLHSAATAQNDSCKVGFGRGGEMGIPGADAMKIGSSLDVNFHGLMSRITDKTGFYSKRATREFISRVSVYDPDVIHLHNIHGYYINIGLLFDYLIKANKRIIWTLHDCWAFTGHCAYFDYCGCVKWKSGCSGCVQKSAYPKSLLCDNSELNFKRKKALFTAVLDMVVITPSNWLAGLVKESFLSAYPLQVINNGVDLEVFKRSESDFRKKHGLENSFTVLGVASIWNERKGLDCFIKLAKSLEGNKDFKIVLVGLSEKMLSGLPENIIGIARTDSASELAEIYSMADIFVNPTLEDNFPTTNLEALACETP
ncbi:MAG: glycosyltransferase, partial [Oscillospiraceae bacterium]|nr:glycosyltransferase [Oscillospiraceae bacterium]